MRRAGEVAINAAKVEPSLVSDGWVDWLIDFFKSPIIRWWLSIAFAGLFVLGILITVYFGAVVKVQGAWYICGWVFTVSGFLLLIYQLMLNKIPSEFIITQNLFQQLNQLDLQLKQLEQTREQMRIERAGFEQTRKELDRQNTQLSHQVKDLKTTVVQQQTNNQQMQEHIDALKGMREDQNIANQRLKTQLGMMTDLIATSAEQQLSLDDIKGELSEGSEKLMNALEVSTQLQQKLDGLTDKNRLLGDQLAESLVHLNNAFNQEVKIERIRLIDGEQDRLAQQRSAILRKLSPLMGSKKTCFDKDEVEVIKKGLRALDQISDTLDGEGQKSTDLRAQ